ncbi:HyaD/HybD family hydrogenase maturation endopeptidase [bacterium]|nr:HyaD/HybD family hydrogenase maturation endopeptidase [bacterium]
MSELRRTSDRQVVLALGNILSRDEGVGIHALRSLKTRLPEQTNVEFLDGGTLGLDLLPLVEQCSHLLVLDAIDAGKTPDSIIELQGEQIPLYSEIKLSPHQITFQEVLGLASMRGKLPPNLHLLGVQPCDLSMGMELSPGVEAAIDGLVERAIRILHSWGLISPKKR